MAATSSSSRSRYIIWQAAGGSLIGVRTEDFKIPGVGTAARHNTVPTDPRLGKYFRSLTKRNNRVQSRVLRLCQHKNGDIDIIVRWGGAQDSVMQIPWASLDETTRQILTQRDGQQGRKALDPATYVVLGSKAPYVMVKADQVVA